VSDTPQLIHDETRKLPDHRSAIERLKKRRDAVILVHNYQNPEVQEIADLLGDSYALSAKAASTTAEVIVFCGVHFMAESAALLCPDKTVLLPEPSAGCPMADMVTAEDVLRLRNQHPGAAVVSYVNSSAAVKAVSDVCCTSANAVRVVNGLEEDQVIFVPDQNLGKYIARHTDKEIILWEGYCSTHHRIRPEDVEKARAARPEAVVIVHPECRPEVVEAADATMGTGGMMKFARETEARTIIVGTEVGLVERMRREIPGKDFFVLSTAMICPNMKITTLDKVERALETLQPVITVPEDVATPARRALQRMLELSGGRGEA